MSEEMDKKIEDFARSRLKRILSFNFVKEFFIFLLICSLAVIAVDEAQKRLTDYAYNKLCVQYVEDCNGTQPIITCPIHYIPINYSSLSLPNSSFNVSSS
jgi:hypothetical protein